MREQIKRPRESAFQSQQMMAQEGENLLARHAQSWASDGPSRADLGDIMAARMRKQFLDHQIPSAEREADRLSAGAAGARTEEEVRTRMGEALGADFSSVRFHTGAGAAAQARIIGAKAYTTGRDVYFGAGGFEPSLAAHELVHTVQQGAVDSGMGTVSAPMGQVQMEPVKDREEAKWNRYEKERVEVRGYLDSAMTRMKEASKNKDNKLPDISDVMGEKDAQPWKESAETNSGAAGKNPMGTKKSPAGVVGSALKNTGKVMEKIPGVSSVLAQDFTVAGKGIKAAKDLTAGIDLCDTSVKRDELDKIQKDENFEELHKDAAHMSRQAKTEEKRNAKKFTQGGAAGFGIALGLAPEGIVTKIAAAGVGIYGALKSKELGDESKEEYDKNLRLVANEAFKEKYNFTLDGMTDAVLEEKYKKNLKEWEKKSTEEKEEEENSIRETILRAQYGDERGKEENGSLEKFSLKEIQGRCEELAKKANGGDEKVKALLKAAGLEAKHGKYNADEISKVYGSLKGDSAEERLEKIEEEYKKEEQQAVKNEAIRKNPTGFVLSSKLGPTVDVGTATPKTEPATKPQRRGKKKEEEGPAYVFSHL